MKKELPNGTIVELSQEEIAEKNADNLRITNDIRKNEIISRLSEIDSESIRAIRTSAIGRSVQADIEKLNLLETEAATLRIELISL